MTKPLLYTALACLTICVSAQASESTPGKPAMPSVPLLRVPEDFLKWEIITTISPGKRPKPIKSSRKTKGASQNGVAQQQKLVTTKTGRVIHEEYTDVSGQKTEMWYASGTQYSKSSGTSSWYRSDTVAGSASADSDRSSLPGAGYPSLSFIKEENYAGTLSYNKRPCLVFVPGGAAKIDLSNAKDAPKKLAAMDTVAFVDADTRLPVEVRSHGEARTFQFDPPPKRMQTLPAELIAQIKKGDDARTRLGQPAPRPY